MDAREGESSVAIQVFGFNWLQHSCFNSSRRTSMNNRSGYHDRWLTHTDAHPPPPWKWLLQPVTNTIHFLPFNLQFASFCLCYLIFCRQPWAVLFWCKFSFRLTGLISTFVYQSWTKIAGEKRVTNQCKIEYEISSDCKSGEAGTL